MSIGWDYVSELLPPWAIVRPHVIYEYWEPRWNDIDSTDKVKLLIRPQELCDESAKRVI
jgi:hypothetical protein